MHGEGWHVLDICEYCGYILCASCFSSHFNVCMEIHDPTPGLYDAILSRSLHFSTPVIPGITDPIIIAYQTDIESLESQQHYFDALRTVFESTVKTVLDSACGAFITSQSEVSTMPGWSDCTDVVLARGAKGETTRLERKGPVIGFVMTNSAHQIQVDFGPGYYTSGFNRKITLASVSALQERGFGTHFPPVAKPTLKNLRFF